MRLLIFAALVAVALADDPVLCNPFPCPIDGFSMSPDNLTIPSDEYTPVTLQGNISANAADNLTVSIEPDDNELIFPDPPEITHSVEAGYILIHCLIKGGKQFGTTVINISVKWWTNGVLKVAVITKQVMVIRPQHSHTTQVILEYIVMAMGLTCVLLAACATSPSDIKKWISYVIIGILLQCLLLPLCCLALIDIFGVLSTAKIGIMAIMNSPASLLAVPVTAIIEGNAGLTAILLTIHFIIANAVLPIWLTSHHSIDQNNVIMSSDIPYDVMVLFAFITGFLILIGMLIKSFYPLFAEILAKITIPLSFVTIVVAVVNASVGGEDLLDDLTWRSGISLGLWPILVCLLIAVVGFVLNSPSPPMRAVAAFLLIKAFYIPAEMIGSAFSPPQLEEALVPAFFLSFSTTICAAVGVLVFTVYACFIRRPYHDMDSKLVVNVDVAADFHAPVPENPLSGADYGVEEKKAHFGYNQEDFAGAFMTAGVPVVAVF